jgi:hypothetical protein
MRYREGLEEMLATLQPATIRAELASLDEAIQKDDKDFDAHNNSKVAVTALQTLLARDHDKVLEEIARSPQRLEPILAAGSIHGPNANNSRDQVSSAIMQLSAVLERLAMWKFPESVETINQWHRKRDAKEIANMRQRLNDTKIS